MQKPSRRNVLLAGLTTAGVAACSSDKPKAAPAPGAAAAAAPGAATSGFDKTADVAIVGAGLAGLTAARELVRRGKSAVVLEARDRVGGRILNHDLGNGAITEVGAQYIGPTQDRILALAKAVGVDTFLTYNEGANVLLLNGKRTTYPATGIPTDPSISASLVKTLSDLGAMAKTVPVDKPWTAPRAAEWDAQTLQTFLLASDQNPGARAIIDAAVKSIWGAEAGDLSLLYALFYTAAAGNETTPGSFLRLVTTAGGTQESRFVGGSQRVALEVAKALGDRVVLSAPVRRIEQTDSGVVVTSDAGRVRAGRVIVAVPPSLTAGISWSPILPPKRAQLAQRTPQGTLVKAEAIYDRPFWRDAKLSGQAVADRGLARSTFDNSPPNVSAPGGGPAVLFGFVAGREARAWSDMPADQRRDRVLGEFVTYFGPDAAKPRDFVEKDWSTEEWTRGCPVAFLPPGVMLEYGQALREPVGRVHWAGTETSTYWFGYMDGAVRSGERAAAEVVSAG
ncbi:MAG TPA: flavin monoamine oxidase family protein [Frankiaceae bacterium]|nr:flavin monoamine oxidase family protein [Frankiaceae bacterium]